jgi:hypothetical protein
MRLRIDHGQWSSFDMHKRIDWHIQVVFDWLAEAFGGA